MRHHDPYNRLVQYTSVFNDNGSKDGATSIATSTSDLLIVWPKCSLRRSRRMLPLVSHGEYAVGQWRMHYEAHQTFLIAV